MEDLIVRPARPDDREAVLAFCEHTWDEFGDYIADVWDEWLADTRGAFLVGEWHGKPVAIGKITVLGPGEIWLEGLRVAPDQRSKGIANAYMVGQRPYLVRLRPRVLRLVTGSHNVAVHHIMKKRHFQHVTSTAHFKTTADEAVKAPTPLTFGPGDEQAILSLLDRSQTFATGHRLYAIGWRWPTFTPARLRGHLAAGEIIGYRRDGGTIAALAVIPQAHDFFEKAGRLWVGLLDGEPEAVADLVRALRRQAAATPDREVVVFVPADSPWSAVLRNAGYVEEEAMGFWIFEQEIRQAS